MACKIFSLRDALDMNSNNKDFMMKLMKSLSNFRCKFNNLDLEAFLKEKSIEFETRNLTRTYIAYDKNPFEIIGYFSIGIKSLDLNLVTRGIKKAVASDDRVLVAPAFLLAHVGQIENSCLEKYELINIALKYIKAAHDIVGGRSVYLDCDKDNEKLFQYYFAKGFRLMSENDNYKQMIMKL